MKQRGFFTDTTLCIGCKACVVACKEWNQLPDDGFHFTGMSYDNTAELGASTWRHVAFIERPVPLGGHETGLGNFSWLFMSDVGKHALAIVVQTVRPQQERSITQRTQIAHEIPSRDRAAPGF